MPDSLPLLDFLVRVLHEALLLLCRIHHQCALDVILQIINQESLLCYHLARAIPADGLDRNCVYHGIIEIIMDLAHEFLS